MTLSVCAYKLGLGEAILVKPGTQCAVITCSLWLDDENCFIQCDWHGSNSKALKKMSFHKFPMAF